MNYDSRKTKPISSPDRRGRRRGHQPDPSRQTNPISESGPAGTGADRARRTQFPAGPGGREANVRNKPNSHPPRGIGGASPTQPGAQLRQTNPIPPGRQVGRVPGRGNRAKQSQFLDCGLGDGLPVGPPIVRNKPNWPTALGPRRAIRAEQTQFPGGDGETRSERAKQTLFRIADRPGSGTDSARQTQFSAAPGATGPGGRGPWD